MASLRDLVRDIEAHHAPVAHWFGRERGLDLQYLDSRIAEGVMLEMDELGVPALPVHDSFIVPQSAATALREAMERHYRAEVVRAGGSVDTVDIR